MRSLIVLLGALFSGVGTAQELRVRDIEPVGILSSAGAGALAMPTDVAIGAAGRLYVVDGGNNRIVIYSPDGDYIKSVGREGKGNLEFAGPIGMQAMGRAWEEPTLLRLALVAEQAVERRAPEVYYEIAAG